MGAVSLSADLAFMCIPSQIIVIVTPRYLMLSTFSRSFPSKVYEA